MMHAKKICIAGLVGGIWLGLVSYAADFIAIRLAPFDIFEIGGMRSPEDPVIILYFLYPFVFAFAAAITYDLTGKCIQGTPLHRGIFFGLMLFLIVIIPNLFIIYSSMTYPSGFYLSNILTGLVGYPVLGILCVNVWDRPD